jgi:hypothetical protein
MAPSRPLPHRSESVSFLRSYRHYCPPTDDRAKGLQSSALSELGGLPGRIARSKQYPKARAVNVLGLLIIFLWPLALAWAYMAPQPRTPVVERRRTATAAAADDLDALAAGQREMSEQIRALERRAGVSPSDLPTWRPL